MLMRSVANLLIAILPRMWKHISALGTTRGAQKPLFSIRVNQVQLSVEIFNQGGTAFDPVTSIAVGDPIQFEDLRSMDVSADDAITETVTCMSSEVALKPTHMLLNSGNSSLESADHRRFPGKRRTRQTSPQPVDLQQCFVTDA